jgi:hypothetical protein
MEEVAHHHKMYREGSKNVDLFTVGDEIQELLLIKESVSASE